MKASSLFTALGIIACTGGAAGHAQGSADTYYYSSQQKIPLTTLGDWVILKFSDGASSADQAKLLEEEPGLLPGNDFWSAPAVYTTFRQYLVRTGTDIKLLLERLRAHPAVEVANPSYLSADGGYRLEVFDNITVKFAPALTRTDVEAICAEHHLTIAKVWTSDTSLYSLHVTRQSVLAVLDMANLLYEDPRTDYSLPDFRVGPYRPWLGVGSPESHASLPERPLLVGAYPNPVNPSTTIRYGLPHRSCVTLTVFNTLGQKVANLVNGNVEAGYHEVQFNAGSLASGVYLYRLQTGSYVDTKKLLLTR